MQFIYVIKDNENPGNPRPSMVSSYPIESDSVSTWFIDKVAFDLDDIEAIENPIDYCGHHLHLGDRWMLYVSDKVED